MLEGPLQFESKVAAKDKELQEAKRELATLRRAMENKSLSTTSAKSESVMMASQLGAVQDQVAVPSGRWLQVIVFCVTLWHQCVCKSPYTAWPVAEHGGAACGEP